MEDKSNKSEQWKSILIKLQELQIKEFGKFALWICAHNYYLISVHIWSQGLKQKIFYFYLNLDSEYIEKTYNDLLEFIKDN